MWLGSEEVVLKVRCEEKGLTASIVLSLGLSWRLQRMTFLTFSLVDNILSAYVLQWPLKSQRQSLKQSGLTFKLLLLIWSVICCSLPSASTTRNHNQFTKNGNGKTNYFVYPDVFLKPTTQAIVQPKRGFKLDIQSWNLTVLWHTHNKMALLTRLVVEPQNPGNEVVE